MKRRLLAASAALALVTLAACGTSSSDDAANGPWTYTDDRGTKISLDSPPRRIVAQSSVAAACPSWVSTTRSSARSAR